MAEAAAPEQQRSQQGSIAGGGGVNETIQNYAVYQGEVAELANVLRQRGQALAESGPAMISDAQASIKPQADELVAAVQDFSDAQIPVSAVVRTFSFASVLLAAAMVGSMLGAYLLGPLVLSLFVLKGGAALLALVVIPVLGYSLIKRQQAAGSTDQEVRTLLAAVAVAQSVVTGYALSSVYASQPLIFVTPAVVAFALPAAVGAVGNNRVNVLGAVLGASLAAHFLLGVISGSLTFAYLLLALLYTGVSGAVIQLLIKDTAAASSMQVYAYEFALTAGFLVSKLVVFGLFGQSAESYAESNKAAHK